MRSAELVVTRDLGYRIETGDPVRSDVKPSTCEHYQSPPPDRHNAAFTDRFPCPKQSFTELPSQVSADTFA